MKIKAALTLTVKVTRTRLFRGLYRFCDGLGTNQGATSLGGVEGSQDQRRYLGNLAGSPRPLPWLPRQSPRAPWRIVPAPKCSKVSKTRNSEMRGKTEDEALSNIQHGPTHLRTQHRVDSRVDLSPRSLSMRPVTALIAAPFLAASVFAMVIMFPNGPGDVIASFTPVEREVNIVQAGSPNVQTAVFNMSEALPIKAANVTRANADCFQDLALAGKDKLNRCAEAVYQALIEVEKVRGQGMIREVLDPNQKQAVERLRFAALDTCRVQWAKAPLDTPLEAQPACKAANIEIASNRE